jgi:aryl-alcohol dehydrogenase-like predicted oxidoreductase
MLYSEYPGTGEKISRLGFGAMGFAGWFGNQSEQEHIEALHRALELGINFIDTARAYGDSERVLGLALKQWSGDKPFVATKIGGMAGGTQWAIPHDIDEAFPRGHITADCERSLKALGLEQVDLMQLHIYWPLWGTSGYWLDELDELKRAGKVRHIGVSIPDHRHDMVLGLVESGRIDAVQTIVNIFDPIAFDNLVPLCRKHGVAVIARCILDEGGLTGFLTGDTKFPPGDFREGYFERVVPQPVYVEKVNQLRKYIPAEASSLASLAIKFALHDPGITTAISSMHVQKLAEMNVASTEEAPLSNDMFERLRTRHRFIKNFSRVTEWED